MIEIVDNNMEMDIELPEIQQSYNDINYAKIVCPGSMRSSYWKFFGFPANAEGQILTRSKIICSICKRAISYNKNTTNLRSHLNARHQNYVQKYLRSTHLKRPQFVYVGERNITEEEVEEPDEDETAAIAIPQPIQVKVKNETDSIGGDAADQLISILTEEVIEVEDPKYTVNNRTSTTKPDFVDIEYLTTLSEETGCYKAEEEHGHLTENLQQKNFTISMPSTSKKITTFNSNSGDLIRMIGDMICTDLLSLNIVDGSGFQTFLQNFVPNGQVPSSEMVKLSLKAQFKEQSEQIHNSLIAQIKDKHFSLGFEIWTNINKKNFTTVSINYIAENTLETQIIGVVDGNHIDWNNYFESLNMEMCSAAIVNTDIKENDALSQFFYLHNISIVPCFITLISNVANRCFQSVTVADILKRSMDFVNETNEIITMNIRVPEIDDEFWQSKYDFLEFFTEDYFNTFEVTDSDFQNLCADVKTILDCMKPLKLTVDTILSENVALCSLTKFLIQQLVNLNFTVSETDSVIEMELKSIVSEELEKSITDNQFLLIASFLDPRLQSFINDDTEVDQIKIKVREICRCKDEETTATVKPEDRSDSPAQNKKKSGLYFFVANKERKPLVKKTKNPFEREFAQYRDEVTESFEQNPIIWWNEYGCMYSTLRQAANMFNCVPATLQNRNLTPQQYGKFYERRMILSGEMVEAILWLNQFIK